MCDRGTDGVRQPVAIFHHRDVHHVCRSPGGAGARKRLYSQLLGWRPRLFRSGNSSLFCIKRPLLSLLFPSIPPLLTNLDQEVNNLEYAASQITSSE